jgi:hypothetical protein
VAREVHISVHILIANTMQHVVCSGLSMSSVACHLTRTLYMMENIMYVEPNV